MVWHSASRPFVLPMTVISADIDDQEIASNVAILSWMIRAAVAHSTELGYDWAAYRRLNSMFVVRRHEIDYKRPALLGDRILLRTWPSLLKAATAHRMHELVRAADGAVIAQGMNVWAYLDRSTGRPTRMPEELIGAFDPSLFL
ncbi:MAG: thioesterase family protein [Myxococcota bacterium]|nr:thioesterase family protein [Myxococcota bacterium]